MGDEIFSVYLTPADYSKLAYAKLDLPASPWKLLDAMDKVRLPEGDSLYLEITDYAWRSDTRAGRPICKWYDCLSLLWTMESLPLRGAGRK